jgi:hypothetical protein
VGPGEDAVIGEGEQFRCPWQLLAKIALFHMQRLCKNEVNPSLSIRRSNIPIVSRQYLCVYCQGRCTRYDNFSLLPFLKNSRNKGSVVLRHYFVHSDCGCFETSGYDYPLMQNQISDDRISQMAERTLRSFRRRLGFWRVGPVTKFCVRDKLQENLWKCEQCQCVFRFDTTRTVS